MRFSDQPQPAHCGLFYDPEKSGKASRAVRLDFQRVNATRAVSSPAHQDAGLT